MGFPCASQDLCRRVHAVRYDYRGQWPGKQLGDKLRARAGSEGVEHRRLIVAQDLDTVRVSQVQVPDQRRGSGSFALDRGTAVLACDPGQFERFAVVVMQPRDVDLQHRVAIVR